MRQIWIWKQILCVCVIAQGLPYFKAENLSLKVLQVTNINTDFFFLFCTIHLKYLDYILMLYFHFI